MTIKEKKLVQPTEFANWTMPVMVLSDDLRGFLPWVIKAHTSGNWNHIMFMARQDFVVTQNNVLKEIPIQKYMTSTQLLKFWRVKGVTPEQLAELIAEVDRRMKLPWWKRSYDYLGIVGQAVHLPWIQAPFAWFCSEVVVDFFKKYLSFPWLRPDPSDMDAWFKAHPETYELMGYWIEGGYVSLLEVSKKEEAQNVVV